MPELLPLFLNLAGRTVLLVGGGPVATGKLRQLLAAGAQVHVVAPEVTDELSRLVSSPTGRQPAVDDASAVSGSLSLARRPFTPADLDDAWLVVAAATPQVNRQVADAAERRKIFVNAVDDPANASAFLGGVVRRDGVTLAISTSGAAPALAALLREGLDALLPRDLASWMWQARAARVAWRRDRIPMAARKPRLLQALNALYPDHAGARFAGGVAAGVTTIATIERPRIPWLNAPEDSWL